MVKNLQAATTNAVRKLKGAFTLALTGTPVENHLGEYYAIMDLCLPGLLGTREEFSRKLNRDGAAGTARLIGRTRPFVLRRTKQLIASAENLHQSQPKTEASLKILITQKRSASTTQIDNPTQRDNPNRTPPHFFARANEVESE